MASIAPPVNTAPHFGTRVHGDYSNVTLYRLKNIHSQGYRTLCSSFKNVKQKENRRLSWNFVWHKLQHFHVSVYHVHNTETRRFKIIWIHRNQLPSRWRTCRTGPILFFAHLSNTLEQLRAEMMHVLKKQRETEQKAPSRIYIPQITKPFTSFLLDTLPSSKHLKLTQ